MAHRHFEGKAHAMLYSQYRPVPPTVLIERMISFLKEKYEGNLDLAYDVGCGSGQSTAFLAPYFKKVVGTDVSTNQVEQARKKNAIPNVTFQVGPAETIPEADDSVQLISVSHAAHWFDLPRFFEEGNRVLTPGGIMCLYGYELPRLRCNDDPNKNQALDQALTDFYSVDLGDYVFAQSREVYLGKYNLLKYKPSFASEFTRDDSMYYDMETRLSDIANYCSTWSGYQNFIKKNGDVEGLKLIHKFQKRVLSTLNVSTSPSDTVLTKRTSFFLLMARK